MRDIIKLLRVKHYIKNFTIFIPLVFGMKLLQVEALTRALIGFVCFCLISSAVYIMNDIHDVENDRKHPKKKERPIASGRVSVRTGWMLFAGCLVIPAVILVATRQNLASMILIAVYFVINLLYSNGLKNEPIIDVVILAAGFVLRIVFGGAITDTEISAWLYLVVVAGSLFMGLGKRRNELMKGTETRGVLKFYNKEFLDKNMYVFASMIDVFYALWAIEMGNQHVIWTLPVMFILIMRYSYDIEGRSDGDPVEVILSDKILIGIVVVYAAMMMSFLYL